MCTLRAISGGIMLKQISLNTLPEEYNTIINVACLKYIGICFPETQIHWVWSIVINA